MSSTAVVVQVLSHEKRLGAPVGRASLAVLLLQDIAAVPVLFVISVFGMTAVATSPGPSSRRWSSCIGLIVAGRLVLRPLFRSVARTGSPELFVAACLLVILATGLATAAVGLPMELGSLIAGLLLAETEFRRQIEVTIDPFRGLLLGVFLISVGMSLDLAGIVADAPRVVLGCIVLVAVKLAIIACLARAFGLRWLTGLQAGLLLGPGGEFGFVILGLARAEGLIGADIARFPLVLAAATMAAIPLLSTLGQLLSRRALRGRRSIPTLLALPPDDATPRVIIAGFGRVGETVASLLEKHACAYVAVDGDADRVAEQRKLRRPVYWGDITQTELLHRLHVETARALVVTMGDHAASDRLVGRRRGRTARPADHGACAGRAPRGASLRDRRHRRGARNHRGQPATIRSGAGGDRPRDGSGDRHHPRAPRRAAGGDQGDGATGEMCVHAGAAPVARYAGRAVTPRCQFSIVYPPAPSANSPAPSACTRPSRAPRPA